MALACAMAVSRQVAKVYIQINLFGRVLFDQVLRNKTKRRTKKDKVQKMEEQKIKTYIRCKKSNQKYLSDSPGSRCFEETKLE